MAYVLPYCEVYTCPLCLNQRVSCHVCHGAGVLRDCHAMIEACRYVWGIAKCACDACRRVGRVLAQ